MKKNSTFKRFLAFLLCAAMMITYMPSSVYTLAEEETGTPEVAADTGNGAGENTTSGHPDTTVATETPVETTPAPSEPEVVETADDQQEEAKETETPETRAGPSDNSDAAAEETEEPAYPAVKLEGKAGDVDVEVEAPEGALPKGVNLVVTGVSDAEEIVAGFIPEDKAIDDIASAEISFEVDGKRVTPERDVTVRVSSSIQGNDLAVYNKDRNGNVKELNGAMTANGGEFEGRDFARLVMVTVKDKEDSDTEEAGEEREDAEEADPDAEKPAEEGLTEEEPETNDTEDGSAVGNLLKSLARGVRGGESQPEMITVTFDPTTDPNEPQSPDEIEVEKGTAIGGKLPEVPTVSGYKTSWVIKGTDTPVTADTVVDEPFDVEVNIGDKITYTVTFVQEDGTEVTRTTDIDSGFAINNLPEVTPKTNKIGKWVYPGTTNEFTVGTVVSDNLTVEAYYEQNIFAVTFMVGDAVYEEMTTATGTTITLPTDPIKEGASFIGWFTEPGGQIPMITAESKALIPSTESGLIECSTNTAVLLFCCDFHIINAYIASRNLEA